MPLTKLNLLQTTSRNSGSRLLPDCTRRSIEPVRRCLQRQDPIGQQPVGQLLEEAQSGASDQTQPTA
jgi:hypothetical protein